MLNLNYLKEKLIICLHDEKQHQMILFCLNHFQAQQDTFEVAPKHHPNSHRLIDYVNLFQLWIYYLRL